MRNPLLKITTAALAVFGAVAVAKADTLINNFNSSHDYIANGIIGDANWDGVYLNFGDVPLGNNDGAPASTLVANETFFPGFLSLRTQGTDWSGANDDGFFIYKVVTGDFDVSVQSNPYDLNGGLNYDNRANNFCGLLVRAYNTNNSGSPFSTTVANPSENFVGLFRMNQYSSDGEIRISTNGSNRELTYQTFPFLVGTNSYYTNATLTHFLRITRTGNDLNFYVKANLSDDWIHITNGLATGSLTRSDWAGIPLQVGISAASFGTAARDAVFSDFELTGPNVTSPAVPAAPSDLVATATNTGGSLTFSWTLGNPGDSSLVVMRQGGNIQQNPVNGLSYSAVPGYGDPTAQIGGSTYVVYNGTGTSVTVTNLGGNNL
ncbi:MAG TPA: hypothetical protein VFM25_05020, partial [Verrucomicrobiae bacterium]|nr:hypothetical protein [Verrucomicrobiae bacterium]